MSDQKQNLLYFEQKRKTVFLLNEGVSHFVDRLDSFCTYLSSIVDLIDNIRSIYIYICLIDVKFPVYLPSGLLYRFQKCNNNDKLSNIEKMFCELDHMYVGNL